MLDQVRQQIQTHLDELLAEADKLRRAARRLGLTRWRGLTIDERRAVGGP